MLDKSTIVAKLGERSWQSDARYQPDLNHDDGMSQ